TTLLKRLRTPVERALRDANLRSGQLDNIVLAGGATRMPIVRRLVTTMFGRFPSIDFNPDEVVALGAAV
ncbi:molecular chaperone HscC, partial [Mycobacterium tuberculosis]